MAAEAAPAKAMKTDQSRRSTQFRREHEMQKQKKHANSSSVTGPVAADLEDVDVAVEAGAQRDSGPQQLQDQSGSVLQPPRKRTPPIKREEQAFLISFEDHKVGDDEVSRRSTR